jgi:predicted neutral ceramidase superfamily lipid hydrolase
LWWFYKQRPVEQKQISVRRILAWERIITKRVFSSLFLAQASAFLHEMPKHFLTSLEFLNIGLVVALLWYFAGHWSSISEFTQILYWLVIALFIWNTMLLKKLTTTHIIQNLFLFLIVHFAAYVSFFSYFGSAIWPVVFWTIMWNIFTSGFLFYMERVSSGILTRLDYWYWLVAAWLSFICNVFLLLQAPIPGELVFFLTLLYLGVEGALLFYGVRYVSAMEEE